MRSSPQHHDGGPARLWLVVLLPLSSYRHLLSTGVSSLLPVDWRGALALDRWVIFGDYTGRQLRGPAGDRFYHRHPGKRRDCVRHCCGGVRNRTVPNLRSDYPWI